MKPQYLYFKTFWTFPLLHGPNSSLHLLLTGWFILQNNCYDGSSQKVSTGIVSNLISPHGRIKLGQRIQNSCANNYSCAMLHKKAAAQNNSQYECKISFLDFSLFRRRKDPNSYKTRFIANQLNNAFVTIIYICVDSYSLEYMHWVHTLINDYDSYFLM